MGLYSHSRLSTFQQCPLKFKYQYIDKVETEVEQTIEAFLGSMVHEVLEKAYKDMKFQKVNTLSELLDYYEELWEKNWTDGIVIVRKEYDVSNYKQMGVKFITDYYNRYAPFDQTKTLGLETQYTVALDPEEKHKMHVRIDRLALDKDGVYEIHDYKTANSLPTQEKVDSDRQLAIYAYGIKKMYPDAKRVKLIWHYLAFDKDMISERTDEQLEKLREETVSLIKDVESCTEFPAKESALCNWCQFQAICPRFKHQFEVKDKEPKEFLAEDGVKLVNKYAAIHEIVQHNQKLLDELKEELKAFAEQKDIEVVVGSDVKISLKDYPRLSFPKKDDPRLGEFFKTVKELGLWEEFETVDVYNLAKAINNGQLTTEQIKTLAKFIEKGKTTYVRISKK